MATTKPLYRCPVCGRQFARRKQAHSCQAVGVGAHFRGKPAELRDLFDYLCRAMRKWGPLRTDAVKTSINLIPRLHMGGVRVLRDRLRLAFLLDRRVAGRGVHRIERITSGSYLHVVSLTKRSDVSGAVLRLLKEAFDRAARSRE